MDLYPLTRVPTNDEEWAVAVKHFERRQVLARANRQNKARLNAGRATRSSKPRRPKMTRKQRRQRRQP